jgi:eukaryotic translation initiation factor 2C
MQNNGDTDIIVCLDADLACERGRCYLNEFLNLGDDASSVAPSTTGSSSKPPRFQGIERKKEEERKMAQVFAKAKEHWGEGPRPSLSETMFYI